MSTTNPDHPDDPVRELAPKEPGAPKPDDHDISGPPDASVIARGHEEDRYDTRSVLSVPILVILFFVIAFGTTTVLFAYFTSANPDPNEHPQAVDRNGVPLNDRLGRIHRGGEVDQPRLEPLRLRSGDNRSITRPELPGVNSPEIHPEDLRPSKDGMPALYRTGWVDSNKTVARIAISDLMDLNGDAVAKLFPVQQAKSAPALSTQVPTAANAGRAAPPKLPPAGAGEAKK